MSAATETLFSTVKFAKPCGCRDDPCCKKVVPLDKFQGCPDGPAGNPASPPWSTRGSPWGPWGRAVGCARAAASSPCPRVLAPPPLSPPPVDSNLPVLAFALSSGTRGLEGCSGTKGLEEDRSTGAAAPETESPRALGTVATELTCAPGAKQLFGREGKIKGKKCEGWARILHKK